MKTKIGLAVVVAALACSAPRAAEDPNLKEVLDSLYMTVAIVQFCEIETDPVIGEKVAWAGYNLEKLLGYDRAQSAANLEAVKQTLLAYPPDCSEGSADLEGLRTILGKVQ